MDADIKELDKILAKYRGQKSELITILQEVQGKYGYLPKEMLQRIASFLRLAEANVYGVAAFYHDFKFNPQNKKTVRVCQGSACQLRGSRSVLNEVEKQLGIKPGETAKDREYSLETTPCPGLCALAPVIEVNENVYGDMTADKAKRILGDSK